MPPRFLLLVALGVACGGKDEPAPTSPAPEPTADTGPTTPEPTADTAPEPFDELTWTDAATQPLTVTAQVTTVQAGEGQSIAIAWDTLTADAWGAPLDPSTLTLAVLAEVFTDDIPATEALLSGRGLSPDAVVEWWTANVPGRDQVTMGEFTARGAPFSAPNYFTSANPRGWFLLLLDDGGEARQAIRLEPVPGYPDSTVLTDGSWTGDVSFGATSTPLLVPSDFTGNLTIKEVATDSFGAPLVDGVVDGVFLTPASGPSAVDLTALGRPDGEVYRLAFEPGTIDVALSDLTNDDGAFPGVGDQQWLLGLTCSTCSHSVPTVLTWVAPRD